MRWGEWRNSKSVVVGMVARAVTAFAVALLAVPARGQVPGDWNGDGSVTPADLTGFESCLKGPTEQSGATCAAVFSRDGLTVGLDSALAFQSAQTGADDCVPIGTDERGYAMCQFHLADNIITGAHGFIEYRPTTPLCGEGTGSPALAFSFALVGMSLQVEGLRRPQYWSQVGYIRRRIQGGTGVLPTRLAVESNEGYLGPYNVPDARFVTVFIPPNQTPPDPVDGFIQFDTLTMGTSSTTAGVQFFQNGSSIGSILHPNWFQRELNRVDFGAEVYNVNDHVPGTSGNFCSFLDCGFYVQSSSLPFEVEFDPDETQNAPYTTNDWYGARYVSPTWVDVWDSR